MESDKNRAPKLCPMGRLQHKFGLPVADLFFSYYSKPSDVIALGLTPQLKGPNHLWVHPGNDSDVKLTPALLNAALTHERILEEGERVIERIAKVFAEERKEALKLQMKSAEEQFKAELLKVNESIRTFQRNEKEKYELLLEKTVNCIREKLADTIARIAKALSVQHRKELTNYVHKRDVEKINKRCLEAMQEALDEQRFEIMKAMPFLVDNETKDVKEVMELEIRQREEEIKKKFDIERARLGETLRQIEADHTDEMLEAIVTERTACWLNNLNKETRKDSKVNHSELKAHEAKIGELECIISGKNDEIEELKDKLKSVMEEMKALVVCHMNEPLSQLEYLFPQKQGQQCLPQSGLLQSGFLRSRLSSQSSGVVLGDSAIKEIFAGLLHSKLSQNLSKR